VLDKYLKSKVFLDFDVPVVRLELTNPVARVAVPKTAASTVSPHGRNVKIRAHLAQRQLAECEVG
jgi:hypothetical protein